MIIKNYLAGFIDGEEKSVNWIDIEFPQYFYFKLRKWIDIDKMTEEEKEKNPSAKAWLKSFNEKCDKKQAEMTINLPNFNYKIFEKITGITKEMLDKKLGE
jgi:hypothetical protein